LVSAGDLQQSAVVYRVKHPHIVILCQFALAVPLGALKSLPRWVHQGNLLRKAKKFPSIYNPRDYPELRRLPFRPTDYDDSVQLFHAALKCHRIAPIKNTNPQRYSLLGAEDRLRMLFAPDVFEPAWQIADFWKAQLSNPVFIQFVETSFTGLGNFRGEAQKLAHEQDADFVAKQLVARGVLVQGPGGHYQVTFTPARMTANVPDQLYRPKTGPLVGQTEDEFVAALRANDELYNAAFQPVCDAVTFGLLSLNDMPAFARWYLETLS